MSTATVNFPHTVYGGTADVVGGSGSEEWETITLNGTETWGGSGTHGMYTQVNSFVRTSYYQTRIMCEELRPCQNNFGDDFITREYGITGWAGNGYEGQNWIYIAAAGIDNTTDLKAWLTQNPVTVCFVKATPTPFTFTPASLDLQKGDNHIYSNTNDPNISITYLAEKP